MSKDATEAIIDLLKDNECLVAEEFNDALVGMSYGSEGRAVYSIEKIMAILQEGGMSELDAIEHFEYNIGGSGGEGYPLYVYTME